MPTLTWSEEERCLILENGIRSRLDSGNFCVRHEDAGQVLFQDIRTALLDALRNGRAEAFFAVKNDYPTVPRLPPQLYFIDNCPSGGDLQVEVTVPYADYDNVQQIADVLNQIAGDIKHKIDSDENGFIISMWTLDDWHVWEITGFIGLVQQLLSGPPTSFNTPTVAYLSVITGNANLLKGQTESGRLEVKIPYDFRDAEKKHKFTVAVASFANSADGGLIVFGLATKKDPLRGDVITSVCGCNVDDIDITTCRNIIADLVFPQICDLEIKTAECHECPGKRLLAILIPAQSHKLKPFIVKMKGPAMTIPYRTGDRKSRMSVETVHSLLAGRAPFADDPNDNLNRNKSG